MNVLVCEDDPAARFVIKRWLSSTLGCNVTDCEDGVRALELLSERPFDLAVLDLDLPRLGGVEVVEAIRGSEDVSDLPIVILSNERRQEVVRALVEMGISDYLIKPLRAQTVRDRIGPLLAQRRHGRVSASAAARARLGPDTPALLVDGDANFRHVFTSVASRFGPVVTAESGAEALAAFRRQPVGLVFVGEQLGIMGADVLVRKIQDTQVEHTAFVKVGSSEPATAGVYLATLPRPFVPDVLAAALRPHVFVPGPLSAFEAMAPKVDACIVSAVEQVLGMMSGLDAKETAEIPASVGDGFRTVLSLTAGGRFILDLELLAGGDAMRGIASAMVGMTADELDDEMVTATAGELGNMITGRVDAWLKGHEMTSTFSLPTVTPVTAGDALPEIGDGEGFSRAFVLEGLAPPLLVRVVVRPIA